MGKNQDPDPGSKAGMNIPDHISESLEAVFWVENSMMRIRTLDPGWKISDPG
jgi:hypothetical protein